MQIKIQEEELRIAVQDYIKKCGVAGVVSDIKFTASRAPAAILTEVEVNPTAVQGTMAAILNEAAAATVDSEEEAAPSLAGSSLFN